MANESPRLRMIPFHPYDPAAVIARPPAPTPTIRRMIAIARETVLLVGPCIGCGVDCISSRPDLDLQYKLY